MNRVFYVLLLISLSIGAKGQEVTLRGLVQDSNLVPLFGVTIVSSHNGAKGVVTDPEGRFELSGLERGDTLLITHVSYEPQLRAVASLLQEDPIVITLKERSATLASVDVEGSSPIARRFSVSVLEPIDIYLTPAGRADPLLAITCMAASTTSDESASPEFRGSNAYQSIVALNGVPIYDPVRYSDSEKGRFSLFNTGIIDREWIHAGNPPLTFGNVTAGLVDIRTRSELESNSTVLSFSTGSIGAFLSRQLKGDKNFIQIFGNQQYSAVMMGMQPTSFPMLRNFDGSEVGLNLHMRLSDRVTFNSYSFFLKQKIDALSGMFDYYGPVKMQSLRILNVSNLKVVSDRLGTTELNVGYDTNRPQTKMGALDITQHKSNVYATLNHKFYLPHNSELQAGLSYYNLHYMIDGELPAFNFFLHEGIVPTFYKKSSSDHRNIEPYLYAFFEPLDHLQFSLGLRSNIPLHRSDPHFLSYQGSLRYSFASTHYIMLGGGSFHSYSPATPQITDPTLLTSKQINLDYRYEKETFKLDASLFYKDDEEEQQTYMPNGTTQQTIFKNPKYGGELTVTGTITPTFGVEIASSIINMSPRVPYISIIDDYRRWSYMLKTNLIWAPTGIANFSLFYITHPGNFVATIEQGPHIDYYDIYAPKITGIERLPHYHRLDFLLSKPITAGEYGLLVYLNLSNLLNIKNIQDYYYSRDYTQRYPILFEQRILYMGVTINLP